MSAVTDFKVDAWNWWQAALADPSLIGGDLPVWDSQPFQGFYRSALRKGARLSPVAFAYNDGALSCWIDGKAVSEDEGRRQWTWACRKPVSYEAYTAAVNAIADGDGQRWDDESVVEVNGEQQSSHEKPKRQQQPKKAAAPAAKADDGLVMHHTGINSGAAPTDQSERAVIGHNSGDEAGIDPDFENLRDEIDRWRRQLDALLKNGDPMVKQEADKVSDVADKLSELETRADSMRDAEGRPFLEATRAVNAKFKPLITDADEAKRRAKRSLKAFLKKAQEEADAKRREEEERRRKEAADGLDTTPHEQRREAPKAQVGNRRSTSIIKRKIAVIDDNVELATFLLTGLSEPLPALVDEMKKAAQRMLNAGAPVKGAHLEEIEEVR